MNDIEKQELIDNLGLLLMYLNGWNEVTSPWDVKKPKRRGRVVFKSKELYFYAIHSLRGKKYIVNTDIEGIIEFTETGLAKTIELYEKFFNEPDTITNSLQKKYRMIKSNNGYRSKNKSLMKSNDYAFIAMNALAFDIMLCGIMMGEIVEKVPAGIFDTSESYLKLSHGMVFEHLLKKAKKNCRTINFEKSNVLEKGQSVCIWRCYLDWHEFNMLENIKGNQITLTEPLIMSRPAGTCVLVYKHIEYKFFRDECMIKRRENKGEWYPFLPGVVEFNVEHIRLSFDHLKFSITLDNMETYSKVCNMPYLKSLRKSW